MLMGVMENGDPRWSSIGAIEKYCWNAIAIGPGGSRTLGYHRPWYFGIGARRIFKAGASTDMRFERVAKDLKSKYSVSSILLRGLG